MRVIHFADLHIGVDNYGKPLADRGWSSRVQDFLDAFDTLVAYALENEVDAVIFAGDAYKSREPTQTQQREFALRIRRLSDAGIATFLLVGNHDLPNAEGKAHALEIFRTLGVAHVYVGDSSWFTANGPRPIVMETRAGPLQVAFLPWPQVSRWLADHPEIADLSIAQQMKRVEVQLAELVAAQATALDPDIPAILTCHVSMNDFLVANNPASERWMTVGTAPTMLMSGLSEASFDYIALGHHHANMQLGTRTPCWYAGSMERVDFGEKDQQKGFMVFEIDPAKPLGERISGTGIPRLQPVDARRFVEIEIAPKEPDPMPEVAAAIAKRDVKDAVVRVEVTLTTQQGQAFSVPETRRLLESAHVIAGIRPIFPDQARTGLPVGEQPDAASPLETLDLYLRLNTKHNAEYRARLRFAAEDLMSSLGGASV